MVSRYIRVRVTSGAFLYSSWIFRKRAVCPCSFSDRLQLIAFGALQDALGVAARLRNDAAGVTQCLVLLLLLIGCRSLHVAERIDDLGRRVDLLQLHLIDADAGAIVVEHACMSFCAACSVFWRAPVRIGAILDWPTTSRMALSATAFTVPSGSGY